MRINLNVYSYCHTYYEELIQNPPKDVEYFGKFEIGNVGYISEESLITKALLNSECRFDELMDYLSLPSWRPALRGDLVHSERIVLGWKPYVISFDHVGFITGHDFGRLYEIADTGRFDRFLGSDSCRRLLPWSKAARRSLVNVVGNQYSDKTEVLYPAIAATDIATQHADEKPHELLFVSTDFDSKGGREALRAFDRIREDFDVHFTVISNAPAEEQRRYADSPVTFESPDFSRDKLYEDFYGDADVLIHPTHNDSFSYVILEAMNAGLPVVATDIFAVPEIVEDGETGILVDAPETCMFTEDDRPRASWDPLEPPEGLNTADESVVEGIVDATALLLADADKRQEFGERAMETIEQGKFSIQQRNERLERIYIECS